MMKLEKPIDRLCRLESDRLSLSVDDLSISTSLSDSRTLRRAVASDFVRETFGRSSFTGADCSIRFDGFFGGGAAPQKPHEDAPAVRSTFVRSFFDDFVDGSGGGVGGLGASETDSSVTGS